MKGNAEQGFEYVLSTYTKTSTLRNTCFIVTPLSKGGEEKGGSIDVFGINIRVSRPHTSL